jgi:hypothetical protein
LLRRAIARAVRIRLRSILLTSGTTIVGLLPLLVHFRETEDKDIWENLALASIGGLASSTVLIVFAIPALYYTSVKFVGWPWRDAWRRAGRWGRWILATGAGYGIILLAAVGFAAYQGHVLYGVTEAGDELALAENHRRILHIGAIVIAATFALWSAALGTWRAWWKGALALVVGTVGTGLCLSILTLLDLPFIERLVGFEWLEIAIIPILATWIGAIVILRIIRFVTTARRVPDPLG